MLLWFRLLFQVTSVVQKWNSLARSPPCAGIPKLKRLKYCWLTQLINLEIQLCRSIVLKLNEAVGQDAVVVLRLPV